MKLVYYLTRAITKQRPSRRVMPKVGKKEYAYTEAGMKKAKKESKKTGKPMMMKKGKRG